MSFLHLTDYLRQIRQDRLDEILELDDRLRQDKELDAIETVKSYIRHRYDVEKIFRDIKLYSPSATFFPNDLVLYNEPLAFVEDTPYSIGDRVTYELAVNGVLIEYIYECTTDTTDELPTDTDFWNLICENNLLFTCVAESTGVTPDVAVTYTANSYVSDLDKIIGWNRILNPTLYFLRTTDSIKIFLSSSDRSSNTNEVASTPLSISNNDFPIIKNLVAGSNLTNKFAGMISVVNFIPENTSWDGTTANSFIQKDNRNRQIKQCCIAITVYELHKLINPRNVPDLRIAARDEAIEDLKAIQKGTITPDLPTYVDDKHRGERIVFGSTDSSKYYF